MYKCSQHALTVFTCNASSPEQTLRNLVNKSGQRITEMYRQVKKRLKSTTEKELFQKKVAGNQDDTLENTHIMPEEHKKITLCTK